MCNEIIILVDGVEKINISQISSYSNASEFTILNGKFQGSYTYAEIYELFGQVDTCGNRIVSFFNLSGDRITNFPLGVFDVNGDFLGIANNQAELITLWNMSPENASEGPATAAPNQTQVKLPKTSTIDGILTMRFWKVDVQANKLFRVLLDTDDVVLVTDGLTQNTIINGSTSLNITAQQVALSTGNSLIGYTNLPPGSGGTPIPYVRAWLPAKSIDHASIFSGTAYVFHNDTESTTGVLDGSYLSGYSPSGNVTNFSGYLPKRSKQIVLHTILGLTNHFGNIVNWMELTKVVSILNINRSYNYGGNNLTRLPMFTHMNNLEHIMNVQSHVSPNTYKLNDKSIFPKLVRIVFSNGNAGQWPLGSFLNISPTVKMVYLSSISATVPVTHGTPIEQANYFIELSNSLTNITHPNVLQPFIEISTPSPDSSVNLGLTTLIGNGFKWNFDF